ncbi:MAG: dihydroorotate dehydrogenase electron transfer subunit [Chloroflexi bacterium]|nr:dihydroorotate dehydrogenase electron transfer subunit [Chloroflexota bacterium]
MPTRTAGGGMPGTSREFDSEVLSVERIMGDAILLTVSAPPSVVAHLRSGQFFNIVTRFSGSFDPLLRRPYSVYRAHVETSSLTFLVRAFGRGSAWLAERVPGDRLAMLGPLGNSFTIPGRAQRLLMIAGGVGVAPLVMLSDDAVNQKRDVVFVMGAADEAGLLVPSELSSHIEYVVATDDGSRGHHGLATEVIGDYVPWADQIYACGPEPMYRTLRAVVDPLRINRRPRTQISVERGMACGVGACLGCVVETTRGMIASCVKGPVFDLDQVVL